MITLNCPNKKCGYVWDYNGKAPFYTNCPRCMRKVKTQPDESKVAA